MYTADTLIDICGHHKMPKTNVNFLENYVLRFEVRYFRCKHAVMYFKIYVLWLKVGHLYLKKVINDI